MPSSLLTKWTVTFAPAGTVMVSVSKAMFSAVRFTTVAFPAAAGVGVTFTVGVGVTFTVGVGVTFPLTVTLTVSYTSGMIGLWSLLTTWTEKLCAPGVTFSQV